MKTQIQKVLPGFEPDEDIYDELVNTVGAEETLIYIALTEYVVRNELCELTAKPILTEKDGKECLAVRIETKTIKNVIYDKEIKK